MIAHTYYDEDPRVRREAEALAAGGRPVEVFALRRPGDAPAGELRGVHVHRLDVQRHQGASLGVYLGEYLDFFGRAALAAVRAHLRRRLAVVQVHTIPDFLVFAALPLKLAGVPVVLDLHEAMPEFFRSRFARAANPITTGLLELQEVLSLRFADAVITVNHPLAERFRRRGVAAARITVIHNGPSPDLFGAQDHAQRAFMEDGSLRLVYGGAVTPNYELDVLVDALARIREVRPAVRVRLDVYGRGDSEPSLRGQVAALGLDGAVTLHGRVPLESMAAAIAAADAGVSPIRRNPQTELSLPTKILEYAAMGKPTIASDLSTVASYFGRDALSLYRAGDAGDLARAILLLVDDPADTSRRMERTAARVAEMGWDHEAGVYTALIDRLAARGEARP
jgi:glycosyltransferase involved in cell wall biosynthesis